MAVQIYIKKNAEALNAEDNWLALTVPQFKAFLNTEDGKRRKRDIGRMPYSDLAGLAYFECGEKTAKEWEKEDSHHNYLQQIKEEELIEVLSIEAMLNADGEEYGEEMIPDLDEDVVCDVLHKMEIEQLYRGLALLTPKEKQVINCLFLQEEPMSEREMSTATGIPQKTINNRKKVALIKLKKIFEEF